MGLVATILGCGSSGGVPRVASGWGACDPAEPRNRRRRCSMMIEKAGPDGITTMLVDTSPDLREQLIEARVSWLDGVLLTHDHADHTHGLDDLRAIVVHNRRRVAVHMTDETAGHVAQRFAYAFDAPPGSPYPPILDRLPILPPAPVVVSGAGGDVVATPIPLVHGDIVALGFRIGDLAYTPDVSAIPPEAEAMLRDLDVWIVDALRHAPHVSHFTVAEALDWAARLRPRRTILTNLHVDLDYATLTRDLPPGVEPAFDGLRVEFTDDR